MFKSFWFTFTDQLFKSRTISIFDLIGFWAWIAIVNPALNIALPWWGAFLSGITIIIVWNVISSFGLYVLTKAFRSEYFYNKS